MGVRAPAARAGHVTAAAFVLVAVAYVGSVSPVWFIHSDSAVYLGLARSLARGDGYRFNHAPYAKHAPVFPLMLAPVYATLGEDFVAMQVVVALCGLGALGAFYALVRARAGSGPALGVLVLTALCGWFWSAASLRLLAEPPYALFSLVALWFTERAIRSERSTAVTWVVAGLLGTVAIFTHMVGVALVPALAGGVLFARGQRRTVRRRIVAAALVGAMCAGAAVYWIALGSALSHLSSYAHHVALPKTQGLSYQSYKMGLRLSEWPAAALSMRTDQFGWAVGLVVLSVLLVPGLIKGLCRYRSCAEIYLPAFFLVSAIGGGRSGLERYTIPAIPLILYFGYLSLTVLGTWAAAGVRGVARGPRGERAAAVAPRVVMAAVALAVLGSAVYNRVKCSRGASKFAQERQEKAAGRIRMWEELGRRVAELPARARIYPSSGGAWGLIHFFTERRLFNLTTAHRGDLAVIRSMVGWDADYLIYDRKRWRSERRFASILAKYPQCFQELSANDEVALYEVDKEKLRQALAELEGS